MFETKVIVAPNSPSARAKDRIMPARIPGTISGNVIVAKIHNAFAPSVPAASSRRRSTASIDSRIERTISGNPITAQASAAPVQRNAKTMPKVSAKKAPSTPRRPNRINRIYPVTTGGITSGRWTRTLSSERPQNRPRASSIATASATGRLVSMAQKPTRSDSLIAVSSSGEKLINAPGSLGWGEHREAVMLELLGRVRAAEIGHKRGGVGILRRSGLRDRVGDRRMAIGREGADDLDLGLDCRVGLIDDTEGRFA